MALQLVRLVVACFTLCLLGEAAWGQLDPDNNAPTLEFQDKHVLKLQNRPTALSFSRDGKLFASNDGSSVRVWDTRTWKQIVTFEDDVFLGKVALSPNGKMVAFRGAGQNIRLLDVVSGKVLRNLSGHPGNIASIVFSPDGKTIAVCYTHHLKLWDVETGKDLARFPTQLQGVGAAGSIAFSPDGGTLAAATDDEVHLLNVQNGQEMRQLSLPNAQFRGVRGTAFSPDGRFLAAGRRMVNSVTIWNVGKVKSHWQLRWPDSPDPQLLRYLPPESIPRDLQRPPGLCNLAFSGDSRTLIAECSDGRTRVWELSTGKLRYQITESISFLTVAQDSPLFAVYSGKEDKHRLILRDFRTSVHPLRLFVPLDLDKAWADLGGSNAALAFKRIQELASAPKLAISDLDKRLPTIKPVRISVIEGLIQELDADQFEVRDRARRRLEELGEVAQTALSKALVGKASPEARKQIKELLDMLECPPVADQLRWIRAVEILETIGSRESRKVLERLAGYDPSHLLSREAKAALHRLNAN